MRKTILVVDDLANVREVVCDMLQRRGYSTVAASNGCEAYHILLQRTAPVDLVLSDYNLSQCSGFELLTKVKSTAATANIPVVFFTTESNPDKIWTAMASGLSAWIKKPYRAEALFLQIEKTLTN